MDGIEGNISAMDLVNGKTDAIDGDAGAGLKFLTEFIRERDCERIQPFFFVEGLDWQAVLDDTGVHGLTALLVVQ